MRRIKGPTLLAALAVLAWGRIAGAQSFPLESAWRPLYCGDEAMGDGLRDEPGAVDERDLVGDELAPAGMRAADEDWFFLRLRLDVDPMTGDELRPFAWGMAFDLDLDPTTYEVLILADGAAGEVNLFENTFIELDNDPTDPADQPPVATYAFADAGRSAEADADFGSGPDRFLDLALPWVDLEPLGLAPDSEIYVWAASSSSPDRLDGDFACHQGGSGVPRLDDIASERTVADPDLDSDGDGFPDAAEIAEGTDPDDPEDVPDGIDEPGERRLEGGGGCAAAGGAGGGGQLALALLVALAALVARRRRRATSRAAAPRPCCSRRTSSRPPCPSRAAARSRA